MNEFIVKFYSHGQFAQMVEGNSDQFVEMLCLEDYFEGAGKEIIVNLKIPEKFDFDLAQFSISKTEAEIMIKIFKMHFGIK